jgi:hypothetical protein
MRTIVVVFITKRQSVVNFNCRGKANTGNFLSKINICTVFLNAGFTCTSSKELRYSRTIRNIGTHIDQHVVTRTSLFTHSACTAHISSAHWIKTLIPPTLRGSLNLFIVDGNVLRFHLSYPVTTCWRHPDWLSRAYEVLTFSISAAYRCRVLEQREQAKRKLVTTSQIPFIPTECYNLTAYIRPFEDWNYFHLI